MSVTNAKSKVLKANLNVKTNNQKEESRDQIEYPALKKGECKTIYCPEIGPYSEFIIPEIMCEVDDIVIPRKVVCLIECTEVTMECESPFYGKITAIVPEKSKVKFGDELFTIEGL